MRTDIPTSSSDPDRDTDRDLDRDPATDLTQQFWGSDQGWISGSQRAVVPQHDRRRPTRSARPDSTGSIDVTGSIQAIREGFAAFRPRVVDRRAQSGHMERTRAHGIVRPAVEPPVSRPRREATIAQLGAGWFDDDLDLDDLDANADRQLDEQIDEQFDGAYDVPLTPTDRLADRLGIAAIDPLLMRLGIFLLALALLAPIAWAMRDDGGTAGTLETNPDGVGSGAAVQLLDAAALVVPGVDGAQAATTFGDDPSTVTSGGSDVVANTTGAAATPAGADVGVAASTSAVSDASVGDVVQNDATPSAGPAVEAAATVDAVAERQQLECSLTYVAAPGDSWYRIADAAGIAPSELFAANLATVDTVMFPGDDICLPAGATMPNPPPTTPPTTNAPTTAAPETTVAPATTEAPTTTQAPAPPPTSSRAEVQALIREIWPDELEEKALAIAYRESNYVATADNGSCCVGVFQLYWTVHRGWLDDYGITTRNDLKDARKNITAAYALYQRAGGWGPWGG